MCPEQTVTHVSERSYDPGKSKLHKKSHRTRSSGLMSTAAASGALYWALPGLFAIQLLMAR